MDRAHKGSFETGQTGRHRGDDVEAASAAADGEINASSAVSAATSSSSSRF